MIKKLIPFLLAALLFSPCAQAAAPSLLDDSADQPVDVTADTMEYSADSSTVVFRGNVEAVRGTFKMWSETLTLVLKKQSGKEEKKEEKSEKKSKDLSKGNDIDRIIAEKNVRFKNETQHGTAQKATFLAEKNILILEGDPVLQDGDNSIRGNVIRYFMNENRSVVEGSAKKRVHAVFSNEKKGK